MESGEVYRVGSTKPERVDVRVVTSTTTDLESLSANGSFNAELYYRLNKAEIRVPALKDRGEDVMLLARLYLQRYGSTNPDLRIADEALWLLTQYNWPGNERELENCIESACSVLMGNVLGVSDLSPSLIDLHRRLMSEGRVPSGFDNAANGTSLGSGSTSLGGGPLELIEGEIPLDLGYYERMCLERALRETAGDKRKAARLLKMGKSTFYRKLNSHDIKWPRQAAAHV